MTRARLGPIWGMAVAASVCWFGGCHHPPVKPVREPLAPAREAARTDLKPAQVADLQIAYARSLENRGDIEQARAQYLEAVKVAPERGDAWLRLGILYDQEAKFNESVEMYRKALAARPGDPDIYSDVGYSFYLQRHWAEAEMNFRQALAIKPTHVRAHNNLGLLLARTDRSKEALAEFRKTGCSEAEALANLAFGLAIEGHLPEAKESYNQALAVDGSSNLAKAGLAKLEATIAKLASQKLEQPNAAIQRVSYPAQ